MKVPASMSTSNHSNKNINNYSKNQVTNPKNKELRDIIHAVKNKYKDKDMSLSQRFNNAKEEHGNFILFILENQNIQASIMKYDKKKTKDILHPDTVAKKVEFDDDETLNVVWTYLIDIFKDQFEGVTNCWLGECLLG
ncbi:hypothetical protein C1645_830635 [Glomus cerebriforme]|uniref:Uncharacterized protein n=1 Tax=Glomus cerebriforme TaxID=658196 RepID=A0A397SHP8_9GLOM|nr:hypothetical protein C1645_830635 [Glomus cerebriforme]